MEIERITNFDLFFKNNLHSIYLLNMIGYKFTDYENQIDKTLFPVFYNINEVLIFRTKFLDTIIIYQLYFGLCFKLKLINEIIINVHIIDPKIILILCEKNKYFVNINNFNYQSMIRETEPSLIEFFVFNYESMINIKYDKKPIKISECDSINLDNIKINNNLNNKILYKNLLSSNQEYLICKNENGYIIYDIIDKNNKLLVNFNIYELILYLNNRFYYSLHTLIKIDK